MQECKFKMDNLLLLLLAKKRVGGGKKHAPLLVNAVYYLAKAAIHKFYGLKKNRSKTNVSNFPEIIIIKAKDAVTGIPLLL